MAFHDRHGVLQDGTPRTYSQTSPVGHGTATFDWPRYDELQGLPAAIRREPTAPTTMHGAIFLGFAVLKNGLATVDEVLGDYGLVHELAHIREFGEGVSGRSASVDELADLAERLIRRLYPGAYSDTQAR